jgi:hypothetical protein
LAAGSTYTPIATTTLGSAQASYTFNSISGSYTDLVLEIAGTITAPTSASFLMRFNGDTGSNYSDTYLYGNGSAAGSGRDTSSTNIRFGAVNNGSGGQSLSTINVMNYSNSVTNKTVIARYSDAGAEASSAVGLWRNTAAITSITLLLASTSTYATGTTMTLWGILNA